eukprot:c4456_g1_i1.p1 GENE.c4456_g1_i1~~c4456_g1_i1.p1  ORF type:complete len:429 (+),score=59.89 c4456_g1_i1:147-1433(+)
MDKREQIMNVVGAQMERMQGLSHTLALLKKENEQVQKVANEQDQHHKLALERMAMLKRGICLRKYHATNLGKTAIRWLQLSDDATYLFYAADPHFKKKCRKYRISEISKVLLGPASVTFSHRPLHKDDDCSRLFSIVFKDNDHLDFAVLKQKETMTALDHASLPREKQILYTRTPNNVLERDVTSEMMEMIFIGLTELSSTYNLGSSPILTPDKLRWMRMVVAWTFQNYTKLTTSEYDLKRKHIRRIFGYKWYETRFEAIQARSETIYQPPAAPVVLPPQPLPQEEDSQPRSARRGYISDSLRKEYLANSGFLKAHFDTPTPNTSPNSSPHPSPSEGPASHPLVGMIASIPQEDVRRDIIIDALSTNQHRMSTRELLIILGHFSKHKRHVALVAYPYLIDPLEFEMVVRDNLGDEVEPRPIFRKPSKR